MAPSFALPAAAVLALLLLGRAARVPRSSGEDPAPSGDETPTSDQDAMLAEAASTGRMPRIWPGPPPQMASASGRHFAVLADAGQDASRHVLRHSKGPIVDLKIFPSGDRVVTASYSGTAVIWDVDSGRSLHTLVDEEASGQLYEVQVFPSEDRVLTIGENFTASIWSASTGKLVRRLGRRHADEHHRCARVYPGGARVFTGVSDGDDDGAKIWSVDSGEALHRIVQPTGKVRLLEISPDGQRLVTAGSRSAWLWDAETGEKMRGPLGGHERWITGMAFAEGGTKLVTAGSEGFVVVTDLRRGSRQTVKTSGNVLGVVAAPHGDRMITFSKNHIVVRNTTTSLVIGTLDFAGDVQRMTLSACGDIVAGCHSVPWSSAGRAVAWNVTSGRMVSFLRDVDSENITTHAQALPCSVALGPPRPRAVV